MPQRLSLEGTRRDPFQLYHLNMGLVAIAVNLFVCMLLLACSIQPMTFKTAYSNSLMKTRVTSMFKEKMDLTDADIGNITLCDNSKLS